MKRDEEKRIRGIQICAGTGFSVMAVPVLAPTVNDFVLPAGAAFGFAGVGALLVMGAHVVHERMKAEPDVDGPEDETTV